MKKDFIIFNLTSLDLDQKLLCIIIKTEKYFSFYRILEFSLNSWSLTNGCQLLIIQLHVPL